MKARAGDRIGRGDLICGYIQHLRIPNRQRSPGWEQSELLFRASLNHITELVADLPGEIEIPAPPHDRLRGEVA